MTEKENKISNLVTAIVGKVTSLISTHNSDTNSHSDIRNAIPSPSTSNPLADTTSGSVGNSATYAKANHTHPKSNLYDVTVEKQEEAETGFVATYVIKQNNTQVGSKINIPKDFLVKSATMQNCITANSPLNGLNVGDPYLDFVVNTVDDDETDNHIYINVSDLVNDSRYTASTGLTLTNNAFSVNYGTTAGTACAGNDPRLSDNRNPTSHTHKDGDISYESNMNSALSPIDMAMVDMAHANRLAFMPPENITVEVSTNGGSSWSTYPSITNAMKTRLVSFPVDETNNLYSGGTSSASVNNKIRITLDAGEVTSSQGSKIYCSISKKIMIAYTTSGATGNSVKIEAANYPNQTTWENCGTYYIGGWWGWNSIPFFKTFGAYQNQQNLSDRYRYIRLTFSNTGGTGSPIIRGIRLYGVTLYTSPSTMAKTGHIYSYNENQDVTFPAKIIKSGGTSSQFLKADGSVSETITADKITYTKELTTNDNLDDLTATGRYYANGSTIDTIANGEFGSKGCIIEVIRWGTNVNIILQRIFLVTTDDSYSIYYRVKHTNGWKSWKKVSSDFDFTRIKGTDNTIGYIKVLQLKITANYQDKPITIETYQRDRNQKNAISIKFNNLNTTDPGLTSIVYSGDNKARFWLVKDSTSTWSLIATKGHSDKYGEMSIKIDNPNPGITITKLDTHIASLPSSAIYKATYLGPYQSVYCVSTGTITNKPYYRLFNIMHPSGSSKSSKIIFEINSITQTSYAKIGLYFRRTNDTSSFVNIDVIDSANFDLSEILIAHKHTSTNGYVDVFYNIDYMNYYYVTLYDDRVREGTVTQFAPTEGDTEAYTSVDDAATTLYGSSYNNIYEASTKYNLIATKFQKIGGTSSQFLKADGSVDANAYLTYATKTEYIYSTQTSSTSTWTGTSSTISSIERGTVIFYRLNQAPTTTNVTLNLTLKNGTTTGAKGVWIGGTRVTNQFPQGSVIMMIFDGSNWIVPNESPKTTTATVTYTDGNTSTINFVTR